MKVTKYPQSAFTIEESGKKILIDPGNLVFEKYSVADFEAVDAILITHQHPDHLDLGQVKKLVDKNVPLYGNHDVLALLEKEGFEIIKVENDSEFEVAGFKIKPVDIPHCQLLWCDNCNDKVTPETITKEKKCKLHPEAYPKKIDGPPNTGYVINDVFFHPGDGIEITNLKVKSAGIPIGGPTIDYERAWRLAKSLGIQLIIPVHYSITSFGAIPGEFVKDKPEDVEVRILEDGQSADI